MGFSRLYKSWSPYPVAAAMEIDHAQTADIIYFAHIDYPFYKLTRSDHTDWTFAEVTFGPTIDPPTGISGSATTPNTTGYVATQYKYVVTQVRDSAPAQESRASSVVTVTNDLSLQGNYNTLTMPALTNADRYIVYKEQGGSYGYIGGTEGTTFRDQNLIPITSDTPPVGENPFDGEGNYPSTVTFHQQRMMLGRTRNVLNGVWGSQSSDYENFDKSRPAKSNDALSFALVSQKVNAVNQLVSQRELLVLSSDAIWAVAGGDGNVLTPADINPQKESGRGASRLDPIQVDNVTFFEPLKGGGIRTVGFSWEQEGYSSNNVAIFSPHFFENLDVIDWAYQEEPYSCIWVVRSDGALLCFTWEQEQQVWGWTLCETDGTVERVAVISEGGYDRLYAVIRRTVAGTERLFYERMALPDLGDPTTACHLDCAITQVYDPPRNVVDQLWHLEGETVSAHYDGYAVHDLIVANGQIELPNDYEATVVTVGLRYLGEIETLPGALNTDSGTYATNRQQIAEVVARCIDTKGISIGAGGTDLQQVEERDGTAVAELPDIDARDYKVSVPGNWTDSATVVIQQTEPFPAHIQGIFYDMKVSQK